MNLSWKDAVMQVVVEMEEEAEDLADSGGAGSAYCRSSLKGYARTLKAICATVGDEPAPTPVILPPYGQGSVMMSPFNPFLSPDLQHFQEIEKAKEEFRKAKGNQATEERHEGDGVLVLGGPAAPDGEPSPFTSIDPNMPVGARTVLAGAVYKLVEEDKGDMGKVRRLEYDEQETLRIKARKGGD